MIRAMPMMPMEPAKAVSVVRPFLVNRFLSESIKAVKNDIEGFLGSFLVEGFSSFSVVKIAKDSSVTPKAERRRIFSPPVVMRFTTQVLMIT